LIKPNEKLKKYVPQFEYALCDVSEKSDQEIKGAAMMQVALNTLKYVFSDEAIPKLLEAMRLLQLLPRQSALEFLGTVLRYLSATNESVTSKSIKEVNRVWSEMFVEKEGEDFMATLAEQLIKQGKQEGRQEGRQEGMTDIVLRLLRQRLGDFDEHTQEQVRELELNQVERLSEAIFDFKELSDLTNWLNQQAN
jgi:predicted transposase YdaD